MSIRSQIIFAQAQAIHVRSVKLRDHSRSEIHVTGPTCNASVNWYPGNRMPGFFAPLEGRNVSRSMFPALRPVFSVNGWDLDGNINLSNVLYHYAEGIDVSGRGQFWTSDEERDAAQAENAIRTRHVFTQKHPDIPSYVIDEIYENRFAGTPLSLEMRNLERILWKEAYQRKLETATPRNNKHLASTLGISIKEAEEIPSRMTKAYFERLVESLMPARMNKIQAAWNCLKSFPEGALPNEWRKALPQEYKCAVKKNTTIYVNGMTQPAYAFTEAEASFLGFKPAFQAVVDGTYAVDYYGARENVPDHIMKLVEALDAGTFALEEDAETQATQQNQSPHGGHVS